MNNFQQFPVTGFQVFRWPEFQALAKRLGIDLDRRIVSISINLNKDEVVTATIVEQCAEQIDLPVPTAVETTSLHNEVMHTHMPNPRNV